MSVPSALPHNVPFCPTIQGMHSVSGQKQFDTMAFRDPRFGDKQPKGELIL
jgi:hypothetical protein